jgi:hypothetical protein
MRSRRVLLFKGLAIPMTIAGLLIVMASLWKPRTAITRENYERIQVGMRLEEVDEILGGPSRDEATALLNLDPKEKVTPEEAHWLGILLRPHTASGLRTWKTNRLLIVVSLRADDRVDVCQCYALQPVDEPILDLDALCRWLGL